MGTATKTDDVIDVSISRMRNFRVLIENANSTIMWNKQLFDHIVGTKTKTKSAETPEEREHRVWRDKAHFDPHYGLHFPATNVHKALQAAASYWGASVPGKGSRKWKSVVIAAMICNPLIITDMDGNKLDLSALEEYGTLVNGNPKQPGKGGSLVYRARPMLRNWAGNTVVTTLDAQLDERTVRTIWEYAGMYNGMGEQRPERGRFRVKDVMEVGFDEIG